MLRTDENGVLCISIDNSTTPDELDLAILVLRERMLARQLAETRRDIGVRGLRTSPRGRVPDMRSLKATDMMLAALKSAGGRMHIGELISALRAAGMKLPVSDEVARNGLYRRVKRSQGAIVIDQGIVSLSGRNVR